MASPLAVLRSGKRGLSVQLPALLLTALSLLFTLPAHAGLSDPKQLWQLDGNFNGLSGGTMGTGTLTAGVDYAFNTDSAGYHFLQTQPWAPAKRLTIQNSAGNNGGAGSTRTNQWTIVMDVKFDGLQPYAAVLQPDPTNTQDVRFFVESANNLTGTLKLTTASNLSAVGAVTVNTWQRLAITCGNDGAGGPLTVKCYINGQPSGPGVAGAFNGPNALQSTYHLFTDENNEIKPMKLGSFAYWGETLSALDIAGLGGPQSTGIRPQVSWINFAGLPNGGGFADGTGTAAHFNVPYGVATDAGGTIYVSDSRNHVIRKIAPGGVVTTLAGSPGNSGAVNGQGETARFNEPGGIAVDSTGNVYVADSTNHAIRKITPAGRVSTLAGRLESAGNVDGNFRDARFSEPKGIALDGTGNLWVADSGNSAIRKVILTNGTTSTLTAGASFYREAHGVAVDATGTIYVANTDDGSIFKINPAGVFSILAQPPTLTVRSGGIAVDSGGNVYVSDFNGSGITKVTPAGNISLVAGNSTQSGTTDGSGNAARFDSPAGLAVDSNNNLIIADSGNHNIRRMTPFRDVSTIAGNADNTGTSDGVGSRSRFNQPEAVAVDNKGIVHVTDTGSNTIRRVSPTGTVTTIAGTAATVGSADGVGAAARFRVPLGIAVDALRNVYITDSGNHTVRKIDPAGNVSTLAGTARSWGNANGQGPAARFDFPSGIAVDTAGTVYVADFDGRRIRKITPGGFVSFFAGFAGDGSHVVEANRFTTASLTVDPAGNVYMVTTNKHSVERISPSGTITTYAGSPSTSGNTDGPRATALFNLPQGIASDEAGNIYVTERLNHQVRKISTDGTVSTLGGNGFPGTDSGLASRADFNLPGGIAVDGRGVIYVVDRGNQRLSRGTPGNRNLSLPAWRQLNFGLLTDSGNAANSFDFDGDGAANLLEYAIGTDPLNRASTPQVPAGAIVAGNFECALIPPAGLSGIRYEGESSSTMIAGRWSALTPFFRQDTWFFTTELGTPVTRGFLRIKVSELPVADAAYQTMTP